MATSEYKGLTIKFGADTKALNSALREAKSEARGTQTELNLLNKGLKLDPSNVTLLAQKQEVLARKIQSARLELQAYKTLEADANSGKVELSSQQWTKLRSDIALTEQKLQSYESELTQIQVQQAAANSTIGQAGAKLTEMGEKTDGVSQKLGAVGSTLTRTLTLGIAAAGTASVAAATQIDTSLTNVKKTVDGTAEDYDNLKQAAIDFSQTNAVSASQILDVESLGAQLGYTLDIMSNGKSEVQEFGEVVSGLDIATNMDAETAGSELAQFFNIMQIGKEETKNYASAIVDLGNKNATTESSISAMALRIAGAGKQIGLSGADVLGLATALSSLGIEAEMGGSAISTIMSEIDKAVALNSDSLATWAQTAGMTTEEFAAAWKDNAAEALNSVLTGMNGAVEQGGNMSVMLDDLGISALRQTDTMKRLAGGGDTLATALQTANTAWEENIALDNEVENRNNSLAAKFEILKNRVIAVAEEIGRPLADALLQAVNACEPLFTAIENGAKAFSDMSTEEQQAVLAFAGMAAALGPTLKVLGNTSTAFKAVGSALAKVSEGMATLNIEALKQAGTWNTNATGAQKASTALSTYSGTAKAGAIATQALGVAMKAAMGASIVAAIGLVVAGIQKVVEHMDTATNRAHNLKTVQNDLVSSTKNVTTVTQNASSASDTASSSIDTQAKSYEELRKQMDDTLQTQADFATSQKETWGKINGNNEYVSTLADEIANLASKETLTKDEQDKLNQKVQEYNNITGDTISVTDAVHGKLSISTEELKKNTEAWKRNAEAQAWQDRYTTAFSNRIDAINDLSDAENTLREAQEKLDQWYATGSSGSAEQYSATTAQLQRNVENAQKAVDEARGTVEGYDKVLDEASEAQANLSSQTFYASDTFAEIAEKYGLAKDQLQDLCNQYGITGETAVNNFAQAIVNGVDTVVAAGATLSGKTVEEFEALKQEYGIEGADSVKAFATGLTSTTEPAVSAGALVAGLTASEFQTKVSKYGLTGKDAILAFANGIKAGQSEATTAGALISGLTLDEFSKKCADYGIEGDNDIQAFANAIVAGQESVQVSAAQVAGISLSEFQAKMNEYGVTGTDDMNAFASAIAGGYDTVLANSASVANMSISQFQALCSQYGITGTEDVQAFAGALRDNSGDAYSAAQQVKGQAESGINGANTFEIGTYFIAGFVSGIRSRISDAINAARSAAESASNALKNALNINSPSKVTREFGEYFTEGFALGIEDKQKDAIKASESLAKNTLSALDTSMSARAVELGAINMTLNQKQSTEELTKWLDKNLGSIIEDSTPQDTKTGVRGGMNVNLNYTANDDARAMFTDLVGRLETLNNVKGA